MHNRCCFILFSDKSEENSNFTRTSSTNIQISFVFLSLKDLEMAAGFVSSSAVLIDNSETHTLLNERQKEKGRWMMDRRTDRWMDCWGLIAVVISAVGILSMLIFSVNENVAMAAFLPTTLLSFCVC